MSTTNTTIDTRTEDTSADMSMNAVTTMTTTIDDTRTEDASADMSMNAVTTMTTTTRTVHTAKQVVDAGVGVDRGDEAKGKLIDFLNDYYSMCARASGGTNAGHTVEVNGKKYKFHLIPSAALNEQIELLLGDGMVIHLPSLMAEMRMLKDAGYDVSERLYVGDHAAIVFDLHKQIDRINENRRGNDKIGTTLQGIGPTYASRADRTGLIVGYFRNMETFRVMFAKLIDHVKRSYPEIMETEEGRTSVDIDVQMDIYERLAPQLLPMIVDAPAMLNQRISNNEPILIEGANAIGLDNIHGTYPLVTGTTTSMAGNCDKLGIPMDSIGVVYGVLKAYSTSVGMAYFPTRMPPAMEQRVREEGNEYGSTTERPRDCGFLDTVSISYGMRMNRVNLLFVSKLDVLKVVSEVKIAVKYIDRRTGSEFAYFPIDQTDYDNLDVEYITLPGWKDVSLSEMRTFEELPVNCKKFIWTIEEILKVPVAYIGVGPERDEMITKIPRDQHRMYV